MISNKQIVAMVTESLKGRQNAHKRALRKDAEAALNGDAVCREAMAARVGKLPRRGWVRLDRPLCDLCGRFALWCHPDGGLRCGRCSKS